MQLEVAIVGAGPAGLACARALAGMRVLILERESRCGGRISTLELAGQRVDMGASFAFDPSSLPWKLPIGSGALVPERAELGICRDGSVHFAATPLACLRGMHLNDDTWHAIERFSRTGAHAESLHCPQAYALLNGLLHQIHPGELAEYDRSRQRDGLYTWYPDHWEHGNQALVDALSSGSDARVELDAEVHAVKEGADTVELSYRVGGEARRATCSAVVLAVTADVAKSLLPAPDLRCRRLLDATRYAGYLVVALAGIETTDIREFRCIIAEGGSLVVVQQRTQDRRFAALLCYFCGPRLKELASHTDDCLIALARGELSALGIERATLGRRVQAAVKRWPAAGTVLSARYLACGGEPWEKAGERIYLAGDYVSVGRGVGYGVADAIASGVHAAQRLRAALRR